MNEGIHRAPVYPEMPAEPLSNPQVESLIAWQSVDEHRQLIEELFELNTDTPYRLTEADLAFRRAALVFAKREGHHRTRGARELGKFVLATVPQMEGEVRRQSLLEIGCGFGRFGEAMARNAKAKVTFLDRDPEVLSQISPRAGKIIEAEGTQLPFEDESFDKVISAYSSVHWAETPLESVRALNEAIRVAKVGGSTIVIPLFNGISGQRQALPEVVATKGMDALDGALATWAMQEYALIRSLFSLADKRYISITWSNLLEETHVAGIGREVYSGIIDKKAPIPVGAYQANEEVARRLMPAG